MKSRRLIRLYPALLCLCFALEPMVWGQADLAVPDGTTLAIRLDTGVRADRAKPGDPVRATLLAPLLVGGRIAIPESAKITGSVVEVRPLSANEPSRLSLRFEQATWKAGSAQLHAYVTRHLVVKRTYEYQSRAFCPPVERFLPQQSQSSPQQQQPTPPQQPTPTAPAPVQPPPPPEPPLRKEPPSSDLCHSPTGIQRQVGTSLTFTSPAISGVTLRKLSTPDGATVMESTKKNVALSKGMMLEIRHSAQ